jgi:hypothetical protein
MRLTSFTCVLVGIMVLFSACSKSEYTSKNLNEISSYFANVPNNDPDSQIGKFRAKLPYYKQFLAANLKTSPKDEITLIFMAHGSADSADEMLEEVESSQKAVTWILQNTHPSLVGAEGSFSSHLSAQQILADCVVLATDLGGDCNTPEADGTASSGKYSNGVEWYLRAHPNTDAMGIEDKELVKTSVLTNSVLKSLGSNSPSVIGLTEYLDHLRSEMALALVLHRMREDGLHAATIVIGGWHQTDFMRMEKELGIHMISYCAIGDPSIANTQLSDYKNC